MCREILHFVQSVRQVVIMPFGLTLLLFGPFQSTVGYLPMLCIALNHMNFTTSHQSHQKGHALKIRVYIYMYIKYTFLHIYLPTYFYVVIKQSQELQITAQRPMGFTSQNLQLDSPGSQAFFSLYPSCVNVQVSLTPVVVLADDTSALLWKRTSALLFFGGNE